MGRRIAMPLVLYPRSRCALWPLLAVICLVVAPFARCGAQTTLEIQDTHFALNGRSTFLLGFSYYAALGASREFVKQDLDDLQANGFNWLRVWATWGGFDNNISAIDTKGREREPFLNQLKWLVAECDRRGMVMDVTLSRGENLPDMNAHLAAIESILSTLKSHRNWYLDLGNERDVGDARFVSVEELKRLRERVRELDHDRLVTASFGGHDLGRDDVRDAILRAGMDFLAPHRPRNSESPSETEGKTRTLLKIEKALGCPVPVQYQEPFRRGYTRWQPTAEDFVTDLRGAIDGGAAGWCFHNGSQRGVDDEQPRRSFDLRARRLMDQLDEEELKFIGLAKTVIAERHQ